MAEIIIRTMQDVQKIKKFGQPHRVVVDLAADAATTDEENRLLALNEAAVRRVALLRKSEAAARDKARAAVVKKG